MMTATWRVSRGELSTGIRLVTGGLLPLIMATSRQNPITIMPAGCTIGAVWANISWGNYWSWDPKEVWALITLIVYAVPLHQNVLRRSWVFYLYCLMALLSVAVTYFGVNLLLGGMHAYGG